MNSLNSILAIAGLAAIATAQGAPTVKISLGVRETGFAGGTFTQIGGDGRFSGSIEWVNKDVQTLVLDGTWQLFTFDLANDPISGFAGGNANGILEGDFGTIEHIRILNESGVTEEMNLFIDDLENSIQPALGGPISTPISDFEGYAQGDEVVFQEPTFSGSTAGSIAGGASGVDNFVASRSASCRVDVQFVDNSTTRWCRLTTFQAANVRNPLIRFDQGSTVSFWMRGGTSQENLGSQGPGNLIAELHGTGLNTGEQSTYFLAGAQPNAAGALAVSLAGQADVMFLGGNLVSFGGFIDTLALSADGNGEFSVTLPGSAALLDLVFQTVTLDNTVGAGLAFSNAIQARIGQ